MELVGPGSPYAAQKIIKDLPQSPKPIQRLVGYSPQWPAFLGQGRSEFCFESGLLVLHLSFFSFLFFGAPGGGDAGIILKLWPGAPSPPGGPR